MTDEPFGTIRPTRLAEAGRRFGLRSGLCEMRRLWRERLGLDCRHARRRARRRHRH